MQRLIEVGGEFPPAPGRYTLFVNYGCGWSHQVMMMRSLKGLHECVGLVHVGYHRIGKSGTDSYRGWAVPDDPTGNGFRTAYDVYNSNQDYGTMQMTIPILFDLVLKRVVSNDPAQILIMLNSCFDEWAVASLDMYPEEMQASIEEVNDVVYPGINDGVYRCWFASSDEGYDEGFSGLQRALAWIENRLQHAPYLCGERLTLADIRAFPHLFRFDCIYHGLMLREPRGPFLSEQSPATTTWLERIFADPVVAQTCDMTLATVMYCHLSNEEAVRQYTERKLPWMPTAEELEAKRVGEGLPAQISYPAASTL